MGFKLVEDGEFQVRALVFYSWAVNQSGVVCKRDRRLASWICC